MYDRDMRYDGRRMPPRNSRGEFRRRRRRGDRGMDYGDMRQDMRMRDYEMDMRRGDGRVIRSYPMVDRRGNDYGEYDMRSDYRGDMHGGMRGGYEPVEFMGYCSGYYGSPDHGDYRGGRDYGDMRRDYGYDMRGRRDYGDYRRGDYRYDDYGDYGETLSEEELKHWEHKLMSQLDEREKQMFHKDTIMQKAKSMGKPMEHFGEKELYVATLMVYTDYKQTIGQNPDMAIRLAFDWLSDKDVAVKGAEKLAVYYDCIVEGED